MNVNNSKVLGSLEDRIASCLELAQIPAREVDVSWDQVDIEAWDHIGDPIAEAMVRALRSSPRSARDFLVAARNLEAEGHEDAIRFFKDVEHVPSWFDFEETRAGAAMMARNPLGLILGLHSALPYTGVDPNIPRVLLATGRLGKDGDFERRAWETATGFIGVLDVDGMKPGGKQWEMWVRIRLMHSMVRMGILSRGKWDNPPRPSSPVSAIGTGIGPSLFGDLRTGVIRAFGYATDAEADSAARMWQWTAKILGAPPELILRNLDDQRHVIDRIFDMFYAPSSESRDYARYVYAGLGQMTAGVVPTSVHIAIGRYLLSLKDLPTKSGQTTADALELPRQPVLDATVGLSALSVRIFSQVYRIKPIANIASKIGFIAIKKIVERGLKGHPAQYSTHM